MITFALAACVMSASGPAPTLTGLDVLESQNFRPLLGKRVGLITNQTGIDRQGRRNIDLMTAAGVKLVALFSPEHGFLGKEDRQGIGDSADAATGVKVYSLYGDTLRPTPEMLEGIDDMVFDIADVGVRFYTYETTMAYALEACAKQKIPFMVLDRPNPITGTRVEGPTLDADQQSFVGYLPGEPVRHGMTMGELARMFNGENRLGVDLTVVELKNWSRNTWFDATGQPWVNPSPNMRSLTAAVLYPGLCLIEFATNISVGRGTDSPFELIGADYIDGVQFANALNAWQMPGVEFSPTTFTPTESRFAGKTIGGVRVKLTDRDAIRSVQMGLTVACTIQSLYPGKVDWAKGAKLMGGTRVPKEIEMNRAPGIIEQGYLTDLKRFEERRVPYLIYP